MSTFVPAVYKMHCPTCQESFTANHLNRRYCSKSCKTWGNNTKARAEKEKFKNFQVLNIALANNRSILRGYPSGQLVLKEKLLQQGYDFLHYTHESNVGGAPCFVCYDTGYQIADDAKKTLKIIHYKNAETQNG